MTKELQQGSEEWFEARKGKITGSRIGAPLGLNPYSSSEDVMREMVREYHGAEKEFKGNIATEWGNDHEDEAIAAYEKLTGELVISTGFHSAEGVEFLGASPDGLVGEDGMIEVKCPFSQRIKPLAEQPYYAAQIQMELLCADRDWCDFVVWTPNEPLYVERVERNHQWLFDNAEAIDDFMVAYLKITESEELSAPYLEELVVEREDDEWVSLVDQYKSAKEALDKAKVVEASAKKLLIQAANGRKSKGCGAMVYTVAGKTKIKYKDALEKLAPGADLSDFTSNGNDSWAVKLK